MRAIRWTLAAVLSVLASAGALPVGNARATASVCSQVSGSASVSGPRHGVAWRAGIEGRTAVFDWLPRRSLRPSRWVAQADAPWLLIITRPLAAHGRCWL